MCQDDGSVCFKIRSFCFAVCRDFVDKIDQESSACDSWFLRNQALGISKFIVAELAALILNYLPTHSFTQVSGEDLPRHEWGIFKRLSTKP